MVNSANLPNHAPEQAKGFTKGKISVLTPSPSKLYASPPKSMFFSSTRPEGFGGSRAGSLRCGAWLAGGLRLDDLLRLAVRTVFEGPAIEGERPRLSEGPS